MTNHWGSGVDDAARLEAALERITRAKAARTPAPAALHQPAPDAAQSPDAQHAAPPPAATPPAAPPDPRTQEAAARLDGLIAELRAVLGKDSAD